MILKNGKRIDGCSDTVPIGTLNPFLGSTAPYGYLLCQGQKVSKIIYKELYEICGDMFGQSTDTEFYLPDLRGQTIAGYKEGDSTFGTLGGLIGSLTHTHTYSHTHGVPGVAHTHSTGNHTLTVAEMPSHTHQLDRGDYGNARWEEISYSSGSSPVTNTKGVHSTGGGQAHNHGNTGSTTPLATTTNSQSATNTSSVSNVQPTMTLNWIVKAFQLMPNQSYVSPVIQDSDINTYSCNYINNNFITNKNLFDLSSSTYSASSVEFISDNAFSMKVTSSNRGTLYVTIKDLKPHTTYTFSYNVINSNNEATPGIDGYWVTDSGEEIYNTDLSGYPTSFTFNTMEYTTIRIRMYISYAIVETTGTFYNIQLEEGNVRTFFSPTNISNKGEIYSYLERKIGTWIDGKPIYRKVVYGTSPTTKIATMWSPNSLPNIDTCTNIYGMIHAPNDAGEKTLWVRDCCINAFDVNTSGPGIACAINDERYFGLDMFVVVEYTKTTD